MKKANKTIQRVYCPKCGDRWPGRISNRVKICPGCGCRIAKGDETIETVERQSPLECVQHNPWPRGRRVLRSGKGMEG